jgi:hypothetical protein
MTTELAASTNTADVIGSIATLLWPLIVLTVLIVFRRPLASVIGRVSEVDVGTAKVILQHQADIAANTTKALVQPTAGGRPPEIADASKKSSSDPDGAIIDAWNVVEHAITPQAAAAPGASSPSVPEVVNGLTSNGSLHSALVPVAKDLEALRDVAASQARAISPATAKSFVDAAGDLAAAIQAASNQPHPEDTIARVAL